MSLTAKFGFGGYRFHACTFKLCAMRTPLSPMSSKASCTSCGETFLSGPATRCNEFSDSLNIGRKALGTNVSDRTVQLLVSVNPKSARVYRQHGVLPMVFALSACGRLRSPGRDPGYLSRSRDGPYAVSPRYPAKTSQGRSLCRGPKLSVFRAHGGSSCPDIQVRHLEQQTG